MSAPRIKLCTWNVRGIHHPVKRKKILTSLKKEGVEIALLQETHLEDQEHLKLKRDWVGEAFFSSYTSNSRGVCILINKKLPFKLESCVKDSNGRYIIIKGLLYGKYISILNMYAPPGHPTDFVTKAFLEFAELETECSVVGGDFNCHLNPLFDRLPAETGAPSKRARAVADTCDEFGFIDIWRTVHPDLKEFTFFSSAHRTGSRIDYFFVPKLMLSSVVSCDIGVISVSDHSPVFLQLMFNEKQGFTNSWRFNPHLLSDSEFISYFKSEFKIFYTINKTPDISPSVLWETCKVYARGLIISYSKSKKRKSLEAQTKLEGELSNLEKTYTKYPSEANMKAMLATKASLNSLLTHRAEQSIRFAKHRLYECGNKPNKYLARLVNRKSDSQTISSIKDTNGSSKFDTKNINKVFSDFYSKLYTSEEPAGVQDLIDKFMSELTLPKLTDEQRQELNKPIMKQEALEALQTLQSGKAPGPDGLSCEFYKEFMSELIDPFLEMLNDSFVRGSLPKSLTEANISLILKKGKPADECSSYRPISLLNVDFKILSKILARRLERVLPNIINVDQSRFVVGRNSCNNMRRLLNVIQLSHQQKLTSMVIGLDAEKAFDRVEWPFLFSALDTFGLGETFCSWVKLLYNRPLAAIRINGQTSSYFPLGRGTRQGCPLSPLLFTIVIEPLAEAIRNSPDITGISAGEKDHKIALYADDILLFVTNPQTSVPAVLETIKQFSEFSGYKINFSKSEVMPLGNPRCPTPSPFKWSPKGFTYLGISITPSLEALYKAYFEPLLKRIRDDLDRWISLPLSMLGRISLLKMNILPRLLYHLQMVPILLNNKTIKKVNSWFSTFIWNKKKPRLKMAKLQMSVEKGGLAVPNVRLYQLAAQLRYVADWINGDSESVWLDLETLNAGSPLPSLLFALDLKKIKSVSVNNIIVKTTLQAWQAIRKLEGRANTLSSLAPLHCNIDFAPASTDGGFNIWRDRGVLTLGHLFHKGVMLPFTEIEKKYNLPPHNCFRFFQVRSFIKDRNSHVFDHRTSKMERLLLNRGKKSVLGRGYVELNLASNMDTDYLRQVWNKDLNLRIDETTWSEMWQRAKEISICNRTRETQFRILHRLQITPQLRHRMNPRLTEMCSKCHIEVGSYRHCVWSCIYIEEYWRKITDKLNLIFDVRLDPDPQALLLGLASPHIKGSDQRRLFNILTFAARKNILLKWIDNTPPTIIGWHKLVFELIPMEYLTYRFKCKTPVFFKTWTPFFKYAGKRLTNIVLKGMVDRSADNWQDDIFGP